MTDQKNHVLNYVAIEGRLLRAAGAIALIGYGLQRIIWDNLVIPNKRGALNLHGLPGWFMALALFCAAAALLAVVIDHYDRRNNEQAYKSFGMWTARLGWMLSGLALGLHAAGIRFPGPVSITISTLVAGAALVIIFSVIGLINERSVKRKYRTDIFAIPPNYSLARAICGLFVMILGGLVFLFTLPLLIKIEIAGFVVASISVMVITFGRVLYATRFGPETSQIASPRFNRKRTILLGFLVVASLWGIWYSKASLWGRWLSEDETERQKAPAWAYRFDDFVGGISHTDIQKRLSADGFRVRCYGNLQPHEKTVPDDKHVCWTIANSVDGIPIHMIFFFFGPDGLRHIRMDFPKEQQSDLRVWFENQGDVSIGSFGRDKVGTTITGRRGKTGIILTSNPGLLNWVMVMWQAREPVITRVCKPGDMDKSLNDAQIRAICTDWPVVPIMAK